MVKGYTLLALFLFCFAFLITSMLIPVEQEEVKKEIEISRKVSAEVPYYLKTKASP